MPILIEYILFLLSSVYISCVCGLIFVDAVLVHVYCGILVCSMDIDNVSFHLHVVLFLYVELYSVQEAFHVLGIFRIIYLRYNPILHQSLVLIVLFLATFLMFACYHVDLSPQVLGDMRVSFYVAW